MEFSYVKSTLVGASAHQEGYEARDVLVFVRGKT